MAITDIKNRIIEDARKDADQIKTAAKSEAAQIINDNKIKTKKQNTKLIDQAKKELALKENNKLVKAKLDARNTILREKQALINEVFEKTYGTLLNMNEDEYFVFIKNLIKNESKGSEEVIFNKKDNAKAKEIIDQLNKNGTNLTLSSITGDFERGFILKNGGIETNYTISALIDNLKQKYKKDVVKILFNDEN